jgi:hypothetical protein
VEFFRLLAEPRDVREHGFWGTREGRRGLGWPRHGRPVRPPHLYDSRTLAKPPGRGPRV